MANVDLLSGPIDSSLRRFSLPLTISFLIHMLYAWVDMFYVSRLGSNAIAAVGVGEQLLFFSFGIGIGFGVGTGIIVARRVGELNYRKAGETAAQGLAFMFIFAIAIAVILNLSINVMLDLLNLNGEVRQLSYDYLSIISYGIPFNFLIFQVNSMIRSTGNSMIPMVILISANVINAILAPLFIFGFGPFPEWGVYGAGFAAAISQALGSVIALIVLFGYYKKIEVSFKNFRFDFVIIRKILKLGIPASLQVVSISLNRMILTWMTTLFGTVVLTTYMIGLRVDLFVFMSIFAVGVALEIITGQNLGANQVERIFQFHKSAVKQVSFLMIFLGILVFFFGKYFAMLFSTDTALLDMTDIYLKIISFSYVFFSIGLLTIRVISGAGDYFRSLKLVIIVLYLFQLPLAYILSHYTSLHENGIWIAILLSQVFFAGIGLLSLQQKKWLKVKI